MINHVMVSVESIDLTQGTFVVSYENPDLLDEPVARIHERFQEDVRELFKDNITQFYRMNKQASTIWGIQPLPTWLRPDEDIHL